MIGDMAGHSPRADGDGIHHPAHPRLHARTHLFARHDHDRLHGPGFAITERTIDSHVRNLRRKFAEAGCADIVETRAGVGYRLGSCTGTVL